MKTTILSFFFLLFFFSFNKAFAQVVTDTTSVWQISTIDDNEYTGYILSETAEAIELKTGTIGIITIPISQVKKREQLISDASTNFLLWPENPMASRYFWANSGFNIKKGDGYYQNTWVLFNHAQFGIADNFSLGVGMMPLFLFAGAPTPLWISPKVTFPIQEKVHLGVGVLGGTLLGRDVDVVGFGFAYGNATFGSTSTNISAGLGYGFADGEFADRPTLSLAGMFRTGKRGYIITENYYIDTGFDDVLFLSLGGRYVGKKIILDYGGIFSPETGDFTIIPWLSISLPF